MAKLSDKDVTNIAKLASLPLTPEEADKFKNQLSDVVDYFKQLKEVNTDNIDPTSQTTGLKNVFRQDQIDTTRILTNQEVLSGTENTHNGYVVVPMLLKQKDE